jgi:hypothetical protein
VYELRYNIASGILSGRLDGTQIEMAGGSGGRAGSRTPGAVNRLLANNPFATPIGGPRSEGTHLYGPIPMGDYELSVRSGDRHWIPLKPLSGSMHGRSRFAIHGRGTIGSHGCIVIYDTSALERLQALVEKNAEGKGGPYRLRVVAIGQDLDRQLYTA